MSFKPHDALADNLFEAGLQWGCHLDSAVAEELINRVNLRYGARTFELLLDEALDVAGIEGDERRGYKMALGLFYGNRAQVRLQERREAFAIPFAPR